MVGCLTLLFLVGSIAGIIILDVILWAIEWQMGAAGILGLIGFLIGYTYSVEMSIAPRDFWVNSDFEVVKKKFKYGWSVAISTGLISYLILGLIWTPESWDEQASDKTALLNTTETRSAHCRYVSAVADRPAKGYVYVGGFVTDERRSFGINS